MADRIEERDKEFDTLLTSIQDTLESYKSNPTILQENIYTCISAFCSILHQYRAKKGEKGWASTIQNEHGEPAFSYSEQQQLEAELDPLRETIDSLFSNHGQQNLQKGGAGPTLSSEGDIVHGPSIDYTGDDVSLDAQFQKAMKYLDSMDSFMKWFSNDFVGIVKVINKADFKVPPTPYSPPFPVPYKLIFTFITVLLEIIKTTLYISPYDFVIGRYLTSFLLLIQDTLQGNWRQMILTSLGFVSKSGMAASVIGRIFLSAWLFTNPTLRTTLSTDLYKSWKSLTIGFTLWLFTVFAPQFIKDRVESGFLRIRQVFGDIDTKIQAFKEQSNATLRPLGYHIEFKIDLETLKNISLEDIQNIQSLATWSEFVCSKEIQGLLQPLSEDPIFRIVIELLGFPTVEQDKIQVCGTMLNKSIAETIADSVAVVPLSKESILPPPPSLPQTGGKSAYQRSSRRRQLRRSSKLTRRR